MRVEKVVGTTWNPEHYLAFANHRLRPALELLQRIPLKHPQVVYDLGCGAGNVTRLLSECWPEARIYGVDHSPEMLAKAQTESATIVWQHADLNTWQADQKADVLYANAALHWLADHKQLFLRLLASLKPGGCLAVQMPLSWGQPSHRLMRETLADGGEGGHVLGSPALRKAMARKWVEETPFYYNLLSEHVQHLDIWETEYLQVLTGKDPVLQWVSATGLRPVLKGLSNQELARFVEVYRQRLRNAYPKQADGSTLYPFRRLFIVATV